MAAGSWASLEASHMCGRWWQNYRPHWRQIVSAVGGGRAWGLLEASRMGGSGGRTLSLVGGESRVREVVAVSRASLGANRAGGR